MEFFNTTGDDQIIFMDILSENKYNIQEMMKIIVGFFKVFYLLCMEISIMISVRTTRKLAVMK